MTVTLCVQALAVISVTVDVSCAGFERHIMDNLVCEGYIIHGHIRLCAGFNCHINHACVQLWLLHQSRLSLCTCAGFGYHAHIHL